MLLLGLLLDSPIKTSANSRDKIDLSPLSSDKDPNSSSKISSNENIISIDPNYSFWNLIKVDLQAERETRVQNTTNRLNNLRQSIKGVVSPPVANTLLDTSYGSGYTSDNSLDLDDSSRGTWYRVGGTVVTSGVELDSKDKMGDDTTEIGTATGGRKEGTTDGVGGSRATGAGTGNTVNRTGILHAKGEFFDEWTSPLPKSHVCSLVSV